MRKRYVLSAAFIACLGSTKAFSPSPVTVEKVVQDSKVSLEVEPGPVNKELVISCSGGSSNATVTITDLKGSKVLSQIVDPGAGKTSINVSKLSPGTYFVVLTNAEGRTSKLFVKQ